VAAAAVVLEESVRRSEQSLASWAFVVGQAASTTAIRAPIVVRRMDRLRIPTREFLLELAAGSS